MGNKRMTKIFVAVALLLMLAGSLWLLLSGENGRLLAELLKGKYTREQLREARSGFGVSGMVSIFAMSVLQVICTIIPAQPIQVLAGVAMGFSVGALVCLASVLVGNSLIFLLSRVYGDRLRNYFLRNLTFDMEKMANSTRITIVVLLLYMLPVVPYGITGFLAAAIGMRYGRFLLVTLIGAIPSVCFGVGLGSIAIACSWMLTVGVVLVCVILLIVVMRNRDKLMDKINKIASQPAYSSKTVVRKPNRFLFAFLYGVLRIYFRLRGIRLKKTNRCGHIPKGPAIVLCNHGSFLDFLYAAAMMRKSYPNFVIARLYFYHKSLGSLLKKLGGFPKSMFANDMESTRNCLRVLKDGGVLAMMPEARLSTVGCFEDIQDRTYSFLKKAGVPVYTIKLSGDFLADPKWGKGIRRGSLVEAELDILFTAQQLTELSPEEIGKAVEQRLAYDELAWLRQRPRQRYRSRRLAEGLENILTVCPKCGGKYTITTKQREVFCEHCGKLTEIDDRYGFSEDFCFRDFAQWYHWQKEQMRQQIAEDPNYQLQSAVTLRLPSADGKTLTREAGSGVCRLNREGLSYEGTRDGENCSLFFPRERVYRLLFGAGEEFELYDGSEILYFVPEEGRSAVDWYLASMLIYDGAEQAQLVPQ